MKPGISVIIPTLNEADRITNSIRQFTSHPIKEFVEVIVVDGSSIDETRDRAKEAGATVLKINQRNRAAQMNEGARLASHDILYFVHADVEVPSTFYEDINTAMKMKFCCGCYRSAFDQYPGLMRINAYLTRFNLLAFRGGDQTLFITKEAFRKMNGFNEYFTIMEDYDLIKRLWKANVPFELIQKDVIISTRKYQNNSWLWVQISNTAAMIMFKLQKNPELIKKRYRQLLNLKS